MPKTTIRCPTTRDQVEIEIPESGSLTFECPSCKGTHSLADVDRIP